MLRTQTSATLSLRQFWRVAKLSMLRTDGNRTEEAYATNYQKQPSVAVFFWLVIIQKSCIQTTAAIVFSPSSIFLQSAKKCYYEFLCTLDRIHSVQLEYCYAWHE